MTAISKALAIIGSLLLLHAVYSAYEHSLAIASLSANIAANAPSSSPIYSNLHHHLLNTNGSSVSSSSTKVDHKDTSTDTSSTSTSTSTTLPLDITLETLFSIALLCAAVVLSAPPLQPIRWHVWAGQIERRGLHQVMEGRASVAMAYRALEERPGFLDIRAKRREYAAWTKEQG